MNKIDRKTFLKQSIGFGGAMALVPSLSFPQNLTDGVKDNDELWDRLVEANDNYISGLLDGSGTPNRQWGRANGYHFAKYAAAYCCKDSKYYKDSVIIQKLNETTDKLFESQQPDGTINSGNLESPPDTGFIMEPLCAGVYILHQDKSKVLDNIKRRIKAFILKVGEALVVGGIHTPNHRWVICHALARINQLYPNKKYVARIDDWLGEGIFIDEDGHYPERSMNYADVENKAFIAIGRLLNRPSLYEPPRLNLDSTWYYMEPNGDLVTFDSRRQDQYSQRRIVGQYLHYRFLAIHDNNPKFAAIAKFIEELPDFQEDIVNEALFYFMENEILKKELPGAASLETNFERLFATSSLARIRREDTSMTIFGGTDIPLIVASGRSVSPNFFSYRKGNTILKYMRMSARFFSMGYFYSDGLTKKGNKYVLSRKLEAYYFQPLPADQRNSKGDYELTPSTDDRFWSKMSFDKRLVSNVKVLETTIEVEENNGKVDMHFEVGGQEGVSITIELCFDEEGTLNGVERAGDSQDTENYFLSDGTGSFQNKGDKITFGPGIKTHTRINGLEGEKYSVHRGTLRTAGQYVYLTGETPFKHTLTFE